MIRVYAESYKTSKVLRHSLTGESIRAYAQQVNDCFSCITKNSVNTGRRKKITKKIILFLNKQRRHQNQT